MRGNVNSQYALVRDHLEKYGRITSMEAFNLYGITRLAAVIYDLRAHRAFAGQKKQIKSEKGENINRYGRKVSYAIYTLEKMKR